MNPDNSFFSTGQGPGTSAPANQNPFNPGISRGGGQSANSMQTSAARVRAQGSYNLGHQILGRIQTLPREQQLEKLKELQESILKERRRRFENIKAHVKQIQDVEAGLNRQLQMAYRNPGNQAGDESALRYIQTAWLKVKKSLANAQRQFLNERTRLEIHSTEKTSDFETRALKLFGFNSENGEGNQRNSSNNLPPGLMAQMAHPTQPTNPFGPNGGSQQMGQMGLSARPLNPFGPNAISQQMRQMALPASSVNPFGVNGGSQQMGQMGLSAHSLNPFEPNAITQQVGHIGPPARPMNPYGLLAGDQQMAQMAPSVNLANTLATNSFLQQINQLASSSTFLNPFGANVLPQHTGQIQPQINSVNFFGSATFPQQFDQAAPQGNLANPFVTIQNTPQMEQMAQTVNFTNNFAQQPGYPSGNTVFPGNNNTILPANIQLPTMASDVPPDWFHTQSSMGNPTNPAPMNPFGPGQNLAQGAPNFGHQNSQPFTLPFMSSLMGMGNYPLNSEGYLNGGAANPSEQSEIFVFRNEATTGQANDENRPMGPMITQGDVERVESEGEESSVKDSDSEDEDGTEDEDQGADQENDDTTVAEED